MHSFVPIDSGFAHIYSRGVTKEVPLFALGNLIYAKHGSGYIKLKARNGTSVSSVRWDDIHVGAGSYKENTFDMTFIPPIETPKTKRKPKLVAAE